MKKVSLLLTFFLLLTFSMSANVVLTEEFDYTVGDAIGNVEGWTTTGDITSGDGRLVSDVVLNYSNAGGNYILSGSKSLKHNYTSNKTGENYGDQYLSYRSFTKVQSGAVYLTYMYKPDGNQSQANGELLGLTTGTSPSARPWVGRIDNTTDGNPYRIGLTMRSGTSSQIVWGTGEYSIDDVILLVLKYDIANASASLFINPTLGTTEEPTADITDNNDSSPRTKIDAVMFRNQGASKSNYYVGGVRVSTSWAEAVEMMPNIVGEAYIKTDFNDNTWGDITPTSSAYNLGTYPSSVINGFDLHGAYMLEGTKTCAETSEHFTNRIAVDKQSVQGAVTLPAVSNAEKIIVYASHGSSEQNKQLTLQKYIYQTAQWETVETYTLEAKDVCYRFETILNSNELTRLRLANADGSGKYIWKIQTCPYPPTVERASLNFTFGDEVWSDLGASSTTATVNEVDFTLCSRQTGNYYIPSGEKLTGRITLTGKSGNNMGIMELPAVASAAQVDIYASAGSADKDLKVQQYNYGLLEWEDVQTLHFEEAQVYYRFSVTLNSETATRLRLINNVDGSGKQVVRIVTYPTAPTDLEVPTNPKAVNIVTKSFTAQWEEVSNASGYRIVVFKENGDRQTTKEITGAGITQFNITGLAPATAYTYKVAAIGDGETTVDSELSEAVEVITASEITDTYTRTVTNGNYGTICLPKASVNLSTAGAEFFVVAGKVMVNDQLSEIVFDEVTSLVAGKPYVFLANSDELNIPLVGDAVGDVETSGTNGLIGSFTVNAISGGANKYVLSNNLLYCTNGREYYVGENRAYFDISSMPVFDPSAPKAPGRRRVSMKAEPKQTPTGIGAAETGSKPAKLLLNGSVVIIRNGVQYDITGQRIH
ncbi:MAG: fibronectin type III domain-containing protein [Paludibacteraceae bacterium]|nr:fibronectin type III domain-containing protein [Paludibacteraceae bacterium]